MRALFGRLGKQAIVYGVGGSALQIVGLITLPVYARIFVPAQYGILEIATVGFAALLVIVDSGMTAAAVRSFYDYTEDQRVERGAALVTALAAVMFLSMVIAAVLEVFGGSISKALLGTTAHTNLVRIVGVTLPVAALAAYLREIMRLHFRPWQYVASATLGATGAAVAGVIAVTSLRAGVAGVLTGLLIGNAIAAVYGIACTSSKLAGRFSIAELRRLISFGSPLIPAAFGMWGLAFLDRIMLSHLGSLSDTGQYGVGSRYAMVLMFCVVTLMTAYAPFMLSLWQDDAETERRVRARLLTYMTLALAAIGLVLSLFARELTTIIAPHFDRAYTVVGILSTGVALYAIANVAACGISLARQTKYLGAYTLIATLLNVALNFLLIPVWGMIGAATATAAGYGLLAIFSYRTAQRIYHTPYELRRSLLTLLVACPLMGIGALPIAPGGLAVTVKLTALGAFVLTIWRLRLIGEDELDVLRSLTHQLRSRFPASRATS